VKVISQREFDRNPVEVLEALEPGDALRFTGRDGEVIELHPRADGRPWTARELVERHKLLPRVDFTEMRADIDEVFGIDRVGSDPREHSRG
jgi:hypothetical protein